MLDPTVAKDKEHYIERWEEHIRELIFLGNPLIDASDTLDHYARLNELMEELNELVKIAADENFKDE